MQQAYGETIVVKCRVNEYILIIQQKRTEQKSEKNNNNRIQICTYVRM